MGNLQPSALEYCCLAWRRWRAHTKASPTQWDGQTLAQALFSPSDGAMAHYIGVRSGGGVTAAAGATAGLSRCSSALGLTFPLDIAAITGWSSKLRSRAVQPQIPIEVAELVHFDYHAKFNPSPCQGHLRDAVVLVFGYLKERTHSEILCCEEMRQRMAFSLHQRQGQVYALLLGGSRHHDGGQARRL